MKKVNYELDTPYKRWYGSFEVDDDTTDGEIDEMVRDEIWSVGNIMYNWNVEETT